VTAEIVLRRPERPNEAALIVTNGLLVEKISQHVMISVFCDLLTPKFL